MPSARCGVQDGDELGQPWVPGQLQGLQVPLREANAGELRN